MIRTKTEDLPPILNDLPYRAEVLVWLESLAELNQTSIARIVAQIRRLTKDKPTLSPLELKKALILDHAAHHRPKDYEAIKALVASAAAYDEALYPVEHLTGWERHSPVVPLMTGLTRLQSLMKDEAAYVLRLDIDNMSGLNEYHKQLYKQAHLAAPSGADAKKEIEKDAKARTDRVIRLLSKIIADDFAPYIVEKSRSGGDEADIIVTGLTREQINVIWQTKTQKKIEHVLSTLRLRDYTHTKRPNDPHYHGGGITLSIGTIHEPQQDQDHARHFNDEMPRAEHNGAEAKRKKAKKNYSQRTPAEQQLARRPRTKMSTNGQSHRAKTALRHHETQLAYFERLHGVKNFPGLYNPLEKQLCAHFAARCDRVPQSTLSSLFDVVDFMKRSLTQDFQQQASGTMPRNSYLLGQDGDKKRYFKKLMANMITVLRPDYATGMLAASSMPAATSVLIQRALQQKYSGDLQIISLNVGNLGGFNDQLGHENANKILTFFANDIIKDTLKEKGFPPKSSLIGYYRNGDFLIVLPPPATAEETTAIVSGINEKIERHQKTTLACVLGGWNLTPAHKTDTLADIKSDKPGHKGGFNATIQISAVSINGFVQGLRPGAVLDKTHTDLQATVREKIPTNLPLACKGPQMPGPSLL